MTDPSGDGGRAVPHESVEGSSTDRLGSVVDRSSVIVCCGTGGVGKTTTAAALGLAAAQRGRRVALVTIDPARRLADALGLATLDNDPRRVEFDEGQVAVGTGELWACMLDARTTFDDSVRRNARSATQAERILVNRFYRNIADGLGGTQEYMATERLFDLTSDERFDLVIVDTPPTRNALDLLHAPRRLLRLLDNRLFRLFMAPGKLRIVSAATQTLLRSVAKAVGGDVIADAIEFFQAFEGMEAGFRRRSHDVLALLHAPSTAWVLVTSARADAIVEARFFADRLADSAITISSVVANRLTPRFEPLPSHPPREDAMAPFWRNAELLHADSQREIEALRVLGEFVGVTDRGGDVHDMTGLAWMAERLVSPLTSGAPAPPPHGSVDCEANPPPSAPTPAFSKNAKVGGRTKRA